jgi:hypothetical protein
VDIHFLHHLSIGLSDLIEFRAFDVFQRWAPDDPYASTEQGRRLLKAAGHKEAGRRGEAYAPGWQKSRRERFATAVAESKIPDLKNLQESERKLRVAKGKRSEVEKLLAAEGKITPPMSRGLTEAYHEQGIRNVRGYAADILGQRRRIIHGYAKQKGIPLGKAYHELLPKRQRERFAKSQGISVRSKAAKAFTPEISIFANRLNKAAEGELSKSAERFENFKVALKNRIRKGVAPAFHGEIKSPEHIEDEVTKIMNQLAEGPESEMAQRAHRALQQTLPVAKGGKAKQWGLRARKTAERYAKLEAAGGMAGGTQKGTQAMRSAAEMKVLRSDPNIFNINRPKPLPPLGLKKTKMAALGLAGAIGVGVGAYALRRYLKNRQSQEQKMLSKAPVIMFARKFPKKLLQGIGTKSAAGKPLTPKELERAKQEILKSWSTGGINAPVLPGETGRVGTTRQEVTQSQYQKAAAKKLEKLKEKLPGPKHKPLSEEALKVVTGSGGGFPDLPAPSRTPKKGVPIEVGGKKVFWTPTTYTEQLLGKETGATRELIKHPSKEGIDPFGQTIGAGPWKKTYATSKIPPEGSSATTVGTPTPKSKGRERKNPPPSGFALGQSLPFESRPPGKDPGTYIPSGVAQKEPLRRQPTLKSVFDKLARIQELRAAEKFTQAGKYFPEDVATHYKNMQELEHLRKLKVNVDIAHGKGFKEGIEQGAKGQHEIGKQEGLEAGFRRQQAEEIPLRRAYEKRMLSTAKKGQRDVDKARKSNTKWALAGAGIGGVAGGGAALALTHKRKKERQFRSILSEIRFDQQKKSTYSHDIATGALEGGLVGPFTEPIFSKLQGKIPEPIFKNWRSFGKKAAIGAGLGAITTGAVGAGVSVLSPLLRQKIAQRRMQNSNEMSGKGKLIRFARLPVTTDHDIAPVDRQRGSGSPIRVVKDRYSKEIVNRERNRRDANYARTAAVGAVLGTQFRKPLGMPIGRAALVGAGAGLVTQGLVRNLITKHQTDVFGEKTVTAKRIDLAPWVGGAAVAGGVAAGRLYRKSPWARKIVRKYFKANGRLIQFQNDGSLTEEDRKRLDKWVYGRRRRTYPVAEKLRTNIRRGLGFIGSAREVATGEPSLDARGRPKKKEWQKGYFKAAVGTTALAGTVLAGRQALKVFSRAPKGSPRWRIAKAFGEGKFGSLVKRYVPGYKQASKFTGQVKEEIGRKLDPGLEKMANRLEQEAGREEKKAVRKRTDIETLQQQMKRIDDIREGRWEPPKKKPPTELSSRLHEIRFAQQIGEWRISDARGNSARVYKPDHQRRDRSPLPTWKKKGTIEAALAATAAGIPLAIWGGRRLGARQAARKTESVIKRTLKPRKPPLGEAAVERDPYIVGKEAEEIDRERRRIEREHRDKFLSSKIMLIHFDDKDRSKIPQTVAVTGAGTLSGAAVGSQIIGGRPLEPGESIVGKRLVRRHSRFPLAYHEGVGVGGKKVVEVQHRGFKPGMGQIGKVSVERFGQTRPIRVLDPHKSAKVATKAESFVGQKYKYNIFTKNCSNFSELCRGRKKGVFVPSRQWRRAGGGALIGTAAGLGASYALGRLQDKLFSSMGGLITFKSNDSNQILTKRNVAIGGGLAAAGVGATTFRGAKPFLRIAARNWIAKGKALEHGANAGGHFVADYLEGSRKGLGQAPQGWATGSFFRSAMKNPKSIPGKIMGSKFVDPKRTGPSFVSSHFEKFRKGGLEALNHWDWEVNQTWENQAKEIATRSPKRAQKAKQWLDTLQVNNYYGKEKAIRAIDHLMTNAGLDEHQAIRQVATTGTGYSKEGGLRQNDAQVQHFFKNMAKHKATAATGYAKKSLASPALILGGGTTAVTAAAVGEKKKRGIKR